jgi:hypothetical protein
MTIGFGQRLNYLYLQYFPARNLESCYSIEQTSLLIIEPCASLESMVVNSQLWIYVKEGKRYWDLAGVFA